MAIFALVLTVMPALAGTPAGAATTFTITENSDAADADITDARCDTDPDASGKRCTLRAAIQEANDTAGANTIDFDIGTSGTGAKTISPGSELPAITKQVTIDGYTQPGASPNTLAEGDNAVLNVQLDGSNVGTKAAGLKIETSDFTIEGLVIQRFGREGDLIPGTDATGNRIEDKFSKNKPVPYNP